MPEKRLKRLGECIKQARKARKYTQERLSEESGVGVRTIAKIERGNYNPSFEILSDLAITLGMSYDELFSPAQDAVDAEAQRLTGLYRACPPEGQRLIMATVQALANEMIDTSKNSKNQ